MTRSRSLPERADAANALIVVRLLNYDRSRPDFVRLSNDKSAKIRETVPWGLQEQLDRRDVKPVIAALLKDPAPEVHSSVIYMLGKEKRYSQLQTIVDGSDKEAARQAAQLLDWLLHGNR